MPLAYNEQSLLGYWFTHHTFISSKDSYLPKSMSNRLTHAYIVDAIVFIEFYTHPH